METRLMELRTRVLEQEEVTSRLQGEVRDGRTLGERQFRLLQNHVIRLNNSLQDLQERLHALRNVQVHS
jgi:uncharacterized coiled-coil protein SlyX